ncbi:glycosyl transferase family 2 [Ochrobactrum quorumnocens]|uniref:Glycosyl transferase family 2 n=1 Tax=Ochrobactrum quorumnocens TaxID=271865 RepID=A0A248UCW8_9HYPH|nr:hypothetical protein [[Ochrobactrum] quorumnocens]ASV84516.1 glycosyl transferase family 2 [[Ochrobactrum] quorumnocens]
MDISVIVNFHNMRREAPRTLFSLSRAYQQGVEKIQYEVVAIDNNSLEKIPEADVRSFGAEFRYAPHYSDSVSPVDAINYYASGSEAHIVVIIIDGARILSPGILALIYRCFQALKDPFVYTLGMHIGPELQNNSILKGYNQTVEDELLNSVAWIDDGYRLFDISSLAHSAHNGFFSQLNESNCFALTRSAWSSLGGLDRRFQTPGGGYVNLDFFNRAVGTTGLIPVMLLGEATFHQVHGGTATNVPWEQHPYPQFEAEYQLLVGKPYQRAKHHPFYFGASAISLQSQRLFFPSQPPPISADETADQMLVPLPQRKASRWAIKSVRKLYQFLKFKPTNHFD